MNWEINALAYLEKSLKPVPIELNEVDWKSDVSCKSDRIAQHLSAFSNMDGGGYIIFGVTNDGDLISLPKLNIDNIIKTVGNIALNNLNVSIQIHHAIIEYNNVPLLCFYIPQHRERPVCLRGANMYQCYHRSAGATVKMSAQQVKYLVSISCGVPFELQLAAEGISTDGVLSMLNYQTLFRLLEKTVPKTSEGIIDILFKYKLCDKSNNNMWNITNMGCLLFANDITQFPNIRNKAVRVCVYNEDDNRSLKKEHFGRYGYAVGFEGLIEYIVENTAISEDRSSAIRKNVAIYPLLAIREFVANALIHQDFSVEGMSVFIEIFNNRIVITNPGTPLNELNRLIDSPPRSRNEHLAGMLFLMGLCEKRGSGIDIAIEELELKRLPPPNITKGESYTRVFMYGPKKYGDMTKVEKIRACYQHACVLHEKQRCLTNQTLRERFGVSKHNISMVSRVIADALDAGQIKPSDPESISKKGASYVPIYA